MLTLVVLLIVILGAAVLGPVLGKDSRPSVDDCGCWI